MRTLRITWWVALLLVVAVASTTSVWECRAIVRDRAMLRELRQGVAIARRRHAGITAERARTEPAPVPADTKPEFAAALVSPDMAQSIRDLLARQALVKRWFAVNPGQQIPELRFASSQDWLSETQLAKFDSGDGMRRAAARIRSRGLAAFAKQIGAALNRYVAAHDGVLPEDVAALAPYLPSPSDAALLARYEMLVSGLATTEVATNHALGLKPAEIVDPEYDAVSFVGTAYEMVVISQRPAYKAALGRAQVAFAEAHGGRMQQSNDSLVPYFTDIRDADTAAKDAREYQEQIRTRHFPEPDMYFNVTTADPVPKQ